MSTHNIPSAGQPLATPVTSSHTTKPDHQASVFEDSFEKRDNTDLVDGEQSTSPSGWAKALFGKKAKPPHDLDAIATRRSVFDDLHLAPFYWPKKDYENIHRFDPAVRWTYREEKAVLRKVDWKILFIATIGFSALNLDRFNLSQANSASFLQDLHLTTDDFNLGNTLLRFAFLFAELPSQLISKRVGPDRWIPTQICLWSIVSLSQSWLKGKSSFLACRALLGLLQGGFIPELVLYMSYFYTQTELPLRLAGFWMSLNLCAIISSFLGYAILHLDGVAGMAGWRWLFMIEGLITLGIGIISFFNMPPSPTQTKTWFRPRGWFTEREEFIIVNKVLRDDPTKGDMHNREGLTLRRFWTAVCDYDLWPLYIVGLSFAIPTTPPSTYLTLLLRNAGFSILNTNLLAIPSQVLATIVMFLVTFVSELVNERSFMSMTEVLCALPFLVALYTLPSSPNPWLFFGLLTGILSYFSCTLPIQVAWCSRNSGAVASRAVNASLFNMFVQASNTIAAQVYVASDAPRYERGNRILIIACCVKLLLLPGVKAYYIWRNRRRAKVWDAMTSQESLLTLTKFKQGN